MKNRTIYVVVALLLMNVTIQAATAGSKTVWLLLANRTNYSINFSQGRRAAQAERALFKLAPGDAHCLVIEDVQACSPNFDLRASLEDAWSHDGGRRGLLLEMPKEGLSTVMGLVFCNEKSSVSLQAGYIIQHYLFDAPMCAALLAKHNPGMLLPSPQDYGFYEEVIDNKADGRTNNQLMAIFLGMESCFAYDNETAASYLVGMPVMEALRVPSEPRLASAASHKSLPSLPASLSGNILDTEGYEAVAHDDTDWYQIDSHGDVFTEDV
ncbi:hypothetical protein FJ365_01470 [Candidatus Dependentiae bacterium]|nr:hypothetical protein [Candidatus Dependentiae bacterium]